MLVAGPVAQIRREHFAKGMTIKEVARDLKRSRNTVRKVPRSEETAFEYEHAVHRGRSWNDGRRRSLRAARVTMAGSRRPFARRHCG
jgi:predicted transcriptional regulator